MHGKSYFLIMTKLMRVHIYLKNVHHACRACSYVFERDVIATGFSYTIKTESCKGDENDVSARKEKNGHNFGDITYLPMISRSIIITWCKRGETLICRDIRKGSRVSSATPPPEGYSKIKSGVVS